MINLIKKLSPVQQLVASFAVLIFLGSFILMMPLMLEKGVQLSFIDALFTSTSAVCVTGLIVVDTPNAFSTPGEILIMLLIQAGGIGILTFATVFAVLMGHEVSYRNRLILKEHFALSGSGQVLKLALLIIKITLIFEIIGAIVLTVLFAREYTIPHSIYLAVFHSISAFCNAGFSLFSNSLENYSNDPLVCITFMALIICGGLGFPVLVELISWRKGKHLSVPLKIVLWTSAILIVSGAILIHIFATRHTVPLYMNMPESEKFLICMFQSVTARTAGFNTINLNALPVTSLLIIMALMFIGGSPQSTAGGIKTTTFWIIIAGVWSYFRTGEKIRVMHKQIKSEAFNRAIVLFVLAFMLVSIAGGLMIYETPSSNITKLLFETVSAFGTVGLSLGVTSDLNSLQKLIIILLMFIGRIGPISFGLFFVRHKFISHIEFNEIDIPTG